jgi:hypothetical protein
VADQRRNERTNQPVAGHIDAFTKNATSDGEPDATTCGGKSRQKLFFCGLAHVARLRSPRNTGVPAFQQCRDGFC